MMKTTLRRTAVACLLATLGVANHAVHADEFGVAAGGMDGYHSLSLNYQKAPFWEGTLAGHPVDVSLEYSIGAVRAPDDGDSSRTLGRIGLTPFARWRFASNTGIEFGIGANVFSGTHLGDKEISTAFQFSSALGLFHRLEGSPWGLGLRLTHYSNAGIKDPNPGQNYLQLRASYVFP
ncbi:MAG: acyloxyacyl hydrolase [Azovibrio sp.]|uniref:acyloxyacyl hydrolase n=1 Tax=Azovibrio sp. TaxID=1872673 RepID=UPI003C70D3B1